MAEAVKHGTSGLLFERGNKKDLAIQIRRILEEPELLHILRHGIPAVKGINEHVAELEVLYRQAIQGNHEGGGNH
jgi:hypothetical protein